MKAQIYPRLRRGLGSGRRYRDCDMDTRSKSSFPTVPVGTPFFDALRPQMPDVTLLIAARRGASTPSVPTLRVETDELIAFPTLGQRMIWQFGKAF